MIITAREKKLIRIPKLECENLRKKLLNVWVDLICGCMLIILRVERPLVQMTHLCRYGDLSWSEKMPEDTCDQVPGSISLCYGFC